jgi:hypothetical protein
MPNTVSMVAPYGFTGTVSVNVSTPPTSGQTYTPDANGQVLVDPRDVIWLLAQGFTVASFVTGDKVATADNGTTQTLTAAMLSGGASVYHTSAGGTTPSLTLPLATDFIAANPGLAINKSMRVRIINNNSGIATVVTNTGWTLTGTLTLAANTWRDFVVTRTAAGTLTAVSVGTGTNS